MNFFFKNKKTFFSLKKNFRNFFEKEVALTPFNRGGINSMKKSIEDWITENKIDLNNSTQLVRNRNKDVVCRTFHKAGLVVPIDRKTKVGYRPLSETEGI